MSETGTASLRAATAGSASAVGGRRRLAGWGRAVSSVSECVSVRSVAELRTVFSRAREEDRTVVLRGSGCSYGDAALNSGGIVVDMTPMREVIHFDAEAGVVTAEPGVTIRDLWRLAVPKGFWPPVVPGTMHPTLGGCLAMNIHGKNNFRVGTIGEHVDAFHILTPLGAELRCTRTENADVFRAAIGGFGMLGAFTRITLRLKPVPGGRVRVSVLAPRSLQEMIDVFESHRADADYLVGWIDGFARGKGVGRGIIHRADYAGATDDPEAAATLALDRQDLPSRLAGVVPMTWMWRFLRPLMNDVGMRVINKAKDLAGVMQARIGKNYLQSHAAFAFLLDYIPNYKLAFGPGGLIQYQSFVPKETAAEVHSELIRRAQDAGIVPYLLVYKRHRRDPYVLTHSVDGYSMAMDFRVTRANRRPLWRLCRSFDEVVVRAGGRFYFAKDATLLRSSVRRAFAPQEFQDFAGLKLRLDPESRLQSDLYRRLFG